MNPYRDEIENMLRTHTRSHFAQTFALMEAGLNDEEIAAKMNVTSQRSNRVRNAVQKVLRDEPINAKSWASIVAAVYRELLNYSMSEGLLQHVQTRIVQYQKIDPTIPSAALGHLVLGSQVRPKAEKPQALCNEGRLMHTGECW